MAVGTKANAVARRLVPRVVVTMMNVYLRPILGFKSAPFADQLLMFPGLIPFVGHLCFFRLFFLVHLGHLGHLRLEHKNAKMDKKDKRYLLLESRFDVPIPFPCACLL